jgi:hypothetical protein
MVISGAVVRGGRDVVELEDVRVGEEVLVDVGVEDELRDEEPEEDFEPLVVVERVVGADVDVDLEEIEED